MDIYPVLVHVAKSATCDKQTPFYKKTLTFTVNNLCGCVACDLTGSPVVPDVHTIAAVCLYESASNGALRNLKQKRN